MISIFGNVYPYPHLWGGEVTQAWGKFGIPGVGISPPLSLPPLLSFVLSFSLSFCLSLRSGGNFAPGLQQKSSHLFRFLRKPDWGKYRGVFWGIGRAADGPASLSRASVALTAPSHRTGGLRRVKLGVAAHIWGCLSGNCPPWVMPVLPICGLLVTTIHIYLAH